MNNHHSSFDTLVSWSNSTSSLSFPSSSSLLFYISSPSSSYSSSSSETVVDRVELGWTEVIGWVRIGATEPGWTAEFVKVVAVGWVLIGETENGWIDEA